MKKYTDEKVIEIISKILDGEGEDDELALWFNNELSEYMPGISDLIFHGNDNLTAEEILKKAREQSKPVCL
jgi:hypothetical protein